jgi:hypothetical protein
MHAALVEFVEDDRVEPGQERIGLEPCGEDAFGDDQQPRRRGEAPLEANLPADVVTQRPAALLRDAPRDGARRDAPGLQQDDGAIGRQRRREARRLAGARSRGDDRRARSTDGVENAKDVGIDRKRIDRYLPQS